MRNLSASGRLVWLLLVLLVLLAIDASSVWASSVAAQTITFRESLNRTLTRNPQLVAAGYEVQAWDGRVQQAGLAPSPELAIDVQDVAGSGSFRGVDSAESTVSLAWVFERGIRQRRVDAARAGASLAALEAEILRVDVAAETARRFLRVVETQSLVELATQSVELAEDTVAAVGRRVQAGRAPQADLQRARANLATATLDRRDVEYELEAARLRLVAQWGGTRPDFSLAQADPFALPEAEPYPAVRRRMEQNPELLRYLSQQRLDEAEVRLAEARRRPVWEARVGVRRVEAGDDHALVAGVTIPLPIRNRNQGRIAETRALADATRAERDAASVRIETTLSVMYEALQRSRFRAVSLRQDVLPSLELALSETRNAYERGRYSFFEWSAVQAELIEARRGLIEASIESQRNAIEIERLTGVYLDSSETRP